MKQLLAVLSVLLISNSALGQPVIIGRVVDALSKDAIIGARISFDPEFLSDTLKAQTKGKGAISSTDGSFVLNAPDTGAFVLEIRQAGYENGYVEFQARLTTGDTLYAALDRLQNKGVTVEAKATGRTVEDLCCRVEELNAELTNIAPFTPDMQQVMSRYSSCTSYHINCTLDHSQTVRLRGMANPYTLMLLDGVPLFSGLTTQYGMQMIPALATHNARIIEGSSTSVYGNNAMAGVLSFDLKQPTEEREMFLQTNVTSSAVHGLEGAYDLNSSFRGTTGRAGVALVLSLSRHPADEAVAGVLGQAPGQDRYSGYLTAVHKLNEGTTLKLSTLVAKDDRDVRMAATDSLSEGDHTVTTENISAIGRFERSLGDVSTLTVTGAMSKASHGVRSEQYYSLNSGARLAPTSFDIGTDVFYGQGLLTTGAGDHYITTGAEYRYEDATGGLPTLPVSGAMFGVPKIYDFTTLSVFAEDQIALGESWTLLGGARLDHHSSAGIAISPRASLAYRSSPELRHRVMVGQGVKGQALFNEDHRIMHGIYSYKYNEDFDWEKSLSLNYDANWTYTIGEETGGQLNMNVFYSNISGKATPQSDSLAKGMSFFVNGDKPMRLMGIEVQTRPSFNEHWSGSLAFSVINLTQVNAEGARERVPLSPTINADASLMYHDDAAGFATELWGSVIGKQRLPANPYATTSPVLGLLNLRLQKKLGMFTLHAGVMNLLDAEQTDTMPLAFVEGRSVNSTVGFGPLEGREFFAGVRMDF